MNRAERGKHPHPAPSVDVAEMDRHQIVALGGVILYAGSSPVVYPNRWGEIPRHSLWVGSSMGERLFCKEERCGSIPPVSTKFEVGL